MQVKVHIDQAMVAEKIESCVAIKPMKKHGRPYYMGAVFLFDVTLEKDGMFGMILSEWTERQVVSNYVLKTLMPIERVENYFVEVLDRDFVGPSRSLNGMSFNGAVVSGSKMFISKT